MKTRPELHAEYSKLLVAELRTVAKNLGAAVTSKMRKAELVGHVVDAVIIQQAFEKKQNIAELIELHGLALTINDKMDQVARLESHPSTEARCAAYEVRDEILAAGFSEQAIADVPKRSVAPIEEVNAEISGAKPPRDVLDVCEHGTAPNVFCQGCSDAKPAYAAKVDKVRAMRAKVLASQQTPTAPKVEIHTTGELHAPPCTPRVTFAYNLSDLLDDPARKPDAELVKLDGTDPRMRSFVFDTEGAWDLFWDMVGAIEQQITRGKSVVVMILCRGGKHRSVAFGEALAGHFGVTATHHHRHLPIVKHAKGSR